MTSERGGPMPYDPDFARRQREVETLRAEGSEVRELFVKLTMFVAAARASHDAKSEALDAIQRLQSLFL